ncbi:MAG: hypothetical protein Q7J32_12535 [Sphingomonadaceae bacterium]|nr:hypothetical protein [Sphingomonadaceae bacterium]
MTSLNLPEFLNDPAFNGLRFEMGAPLVPRIGPRRAVQLLTAADLEALEGDGLEIDAKAISVSDDGTLKYKNKRVLLYIRDIGGIGGRHGLPRFHVAYCKTLETMQRERRFARYVVATRDDGQFQLNIVSERKAITERLSVCQMCLARLAWNGFSFDWTQRPRREVVAAFTLVEYFDRYPKDLISIQPDHDADTAPLNDYPDDWGTISERVKRERGYRCEQCDRDMTEHKQHFHAHHRDGQKNNCAPHNIELLCLCCHANEPLHAHMKSLPAFKSFCGAAGGTAVSVKAT